MYGTTASGATVDHKFKASPAPATQIDAIFLNRLIEELSNVVTNPLGGNEALDPDDNGQLLAAIRTVASAGLGGVSFTANGNGYAIGIEIDGVFRYIQFGSVFVGNQTTATITYPVALTTIGVCVGSGGPNSNDDSDAHVVSSGTSSATVRNTDGSGTTFFWLCVGF
ncbi:MAG: hypothetical protein ABIS51_18595 [Sphingomonas sp.]